MKKLSRFFALSSFAIFVVISASIWERGILQGGFLFDDPAFLRVLTPFEWGDIIGYFRTDWGWVYRPVYLTYFALMLHFFGANPLPFHAVSVALHLMISVLLATLCFRLTADSDLPVRPRRILAFGCALVFFVRLGYSESLLAASSTNTLLSAIFVLLALHAWLSWRSGGKAIFYLLTLVAFALGLGSKEETLALPMMILVLDVFFLNKVRVEKIQSFQLWKPYFPLLGVALIFVVLSLISQASINHASPKIIVVPRHVNLLAFSDFYLSLWGSLFSTGFSILNTLVVVALFRVFYRLHRPRLNGTLWFPLLIGAPVAMATGSYYATYAERFYYMPLLFLFLSIALGLAFASRVLVKLFDPPFPKSLFILALLVAYTRNRVEFELSRAALWDYPVSARFHEFLSFSTVAVLCWIGIITLIFWLFKTKRFHHANGPEATLILGALWRMPVITLPLMLICLYVWENLAISDVAQRKLRDGTHRIIALCWYWWRNASALLKRLKLT